MTTFRVKNFETFQHYKDRSPPWIKLYNALLDDYAFGCLPDATKMHLVAIWLLASRAANELPYDPQWIAKRISATESVNLDALRDAGFILVNQQLQGVARGASAAQADCLTRERDTNEEKEDSSTSEPKSAREPELKIVSREQVSPSDPVFNRPNDPLAIYSVDELAMLTFEFDRLDVESELCELVKWAERKGIEGISEVKSAVFGALKRKNEKLASAAGLVEARANPAPVKVSPELARSRLTAADPRRPKSRMELANELGHPPFDRRAQASG